MRDTKMRTVSISIVRGIFQKGFDDVVVVLVARPVVVAARLRPACREPKVGAHFPKNREKEWMIGR
ncbi:hypothetical protein [Saccharothrix deserti]|uniref:hypothetical protein n=1 Tax=Saccharothrix deserti TaxID=2593674 RepID=UPI00131E8FF9|nr:hypothetical protein [Saccharothrix deserti]